jgi:hypothetical protein
MRISKDNRLGRCVTCVVRIAVRMSRDSSIYRDMLVFERKKTRKEINLAPFPSLSPHARYTTNLISRCILADVYSLIDQGSCLLYS